MPEFEDRAAEAKTILAKVFPKRTIEQIVIDRIDPGGGSIHYAIQQEPKF